MSADGLFDILFNFGKTAFFGIIGSNDFCFGKFSFDFSLRAAVFLVSGMRGDAELFFLGFGADGISSKYCLERFPPFGPA